MEDATSKTYRCTDYGVDATAHEENGFFVVHAGSKLGEVRNQHDRMMLRFRRFLTKENAFDADGLTLRGDEKFLYADSASYCISRNAACALSAYDL